MIKMLGVFRKKPGMNADEFQDYYETVHVPLVLKRSARFASYRRNFVVGNIGFDHLPAGTPEFGFDVLAEAWYPDQATFDKVAEDLRDPATQAEIRASEEKFFDRKNMIFFVTEEHITPPKDLGAAEGAPDDGSMVKILNFIKRKPGLSREGFKDYYETRHAPLAAKHMRMFAGYRRSYIHPGRTLETAHVQERPPQPDFDAMAEFWFRDQAGLDSLGAALGDTKVAALMAEDEAQFLDRTYMPIFRIKERLTTQATLNAAKQALGQ